MRLLHTSDWHVGRTIHGRPRTDEFAAVLDEVVRIARDGRVDAVLVAGDLFDQRAANPDAERLVFETLARLASEGLAIVAIPGNHDPAARWAALRPLLEPLRVRVVPFVAPPEQGSVVEVLSRDETEGAVVACVPFVPERTFAGAASLFTGSEQWAQEYAAGMGELLAAMARAFRPDRVNVLMAHLYATDVRVAGDENPLTITPDYAVPPARFPATAQYLALGHVHRPQAVPASPAPARYAGSLLQLDFGEMEQSKSLALVEVSPGKPASVREIALASGRRLYDVGGTLEELRAIAPSFADAWLRVTVRTDAPVPGIADAVREILPNAIEVRLDFPRVEEEIPSLGLMRKLPLEQYVAYYRSKHGAEAPAELLEAFRRTQDAIERGEPS